MINVGNNFGHLTKCPACLKGDDKQEHLFLCDGLNSNNDLLYTDFEYSDFFSNEMEKLKNAINRGDTILRRRDHFTKTND